MEIIINWEAGYTSTSIQWNVLGLTRRMRQLYCTLYMKQYPKYTKHQELEACIAGGCVEPEVLRSMYSLVCIKSLQGFLRNCLSGERN